MLFWFTGRGVCFRGERSTISLLSIPGNQAWARQESGVACVYKEPGTLQHTCVHLGTDHTCIHLRKDHTTVCLPFIPAVVRCVTFGSFSWFCVLTIFFTLRLYLSLSLSDSGFHSSPWLHCGSCLQCSALQLQVSGHPDTYNAAYIYMCVCVCVCI